MPANCDFCGVGIPTAIANPAATILCWECVRKNANKLKSLKLEAYGDAGVDRCISNKSHQSFTLTANKKKLASINPRNNYALPFGTVVDVKSERSVKYLGGTIIAKQDTGSSKFIGLGWKSGDPNTPAGATLADKDYLAYNSRSFSDAFNQYSHFIWVNDNDEFSAPTTPIIKENAMPNLKNVKLKTLSVGQFVEIEGGYKGTIIGNHGAHIVIGWKKDDPRCPEGLSDAPAQFTSDAWQERSEYTRTLKCNGESGAQVISQTNFENVRCYLKDVPIGSEVEVSGHKAIVVARKGATTTLGWKLDDKRPSYTYAINDAISSLGSSCERLETIEGYKYGYNYSASERVIMCPNKSRQVSASSLSVGTRVKWNGVIATVISKQEGGTVCLGWKADEGAYVYANSKFTPNSKYETVNDLDQYVKNHWIAAYENVERLESEEKMTQVLLKDLMPGQEVMHPTYGKMIVLGTYASSGEKLLGKKEQFEGSSSNVGKGGGTSYTYWDKWEGTGYWAKWMTSTTAVEVVGDRLMKYGLKLGDKVEVYRKVGSQGLMDTGHSPDLQAAPAIGVIVGINSNGDPNVFFENLDPSIGKLNSYNESVIDKSFLDNKSFVGKATGKSNFWLIRSVSGFKKIEEKKMTDNKERPAFMEMMKVDATAAAYRVAANQMTKGIKSGILAMMEKNGHGSDKIKAISEMLDSEFGTSLVSILLGFGLTYVPHISNDPRAQKLAGEFRVNGMAVAGNAVMDVALEHFLPVITGALSALPSAETTAIRVSEPVKTDHAALEEAAREEAEKVDAPAPQVQKA